MFILIVSSLKAAVELEQQCLEELKKALEEEKQKNYELMRKLGAQNKAVADLQMEKSEMMKGGNYTSAQMKKLL